MSSNSVQREILKYPNNIKIQYSNDIEYRQSLRQLFEMNFQTELLDNSSIMDPVSLDESNYDEKMTKKWMDWISLQTKECYEINELYKIAAATMISLDRETGLAVLFSFDYFSDFHKVLSLFFENPNRDLEMYPEYERLWERLSKK